jgi:hypothetical protein
MQAPFPPTDQAEAPIPPVTASIDPIPGNDPIPPETGSNDANMNLKVTTRRSAANRTEPWYLPPPPRRSTREKQSPGYYASLPPQVEDIPAPARKKRRLEESLPTPKARTRARTTEEAARKTPSPDLTVGLPPPATNGDIDDADADPGKGRRVHWTLKEDGKLISALTNTRKKKWGNEYRTDFAAVAALVPGRTRKQCYKRWHDVFDPINGRASGRKGKWSGDEDTKCGTNARCKELDCNCRTGSGSNGNSV